MVAPRGLHVLLLACEFGEGVCTHTAPLQALRLSFSLCPPAARALVCLPLHSPVVDDGVPSGLVDRRLDARQDVSLGGAQLQPLPEAVTFAIDAASGRAPRLCEIVKRERSVFCVLASLDHLFATIIYI